MTNDMCEIRKLLTPFQGFQYRHLVHRRAMPNANALALSELKNVSELFFSSRHHTACEIV